MNVIGVDHKAVSLKHILPEMSYLGSKKPGGQTNKSFASQMGSPFTYTGTNQIEFTTGSTGSLAEGFVLDGYFLGTFEFDSLTGHPGIRY